MFVISLPLATRIITLLNDSSWNHFAQTAVVAVVNSSSAVSAMSGHNSRTPHFADIGRILLWWLGHWSIRTFAGSSSSVLCDFTVWVPSHLLLWMRCNFSHATAKKKKKKTQTNKPPTEKSHDGKCCTVDNRLSAAFSSSIYSFYISALQQCGTNYLLLV